MSVGLKSHKDLEVYKESMSLVEDIYRITKELPSDEKFGLISQMRRASISIVSNIAEGAARKNTKEYIQFLYISLGSLSEIETQLEVSKRLEYYESNDEMNRRINYINSMLTGLIKSLKLNLK
jgi:four helix bundle protein